MNRLIGKIHPMTVVAAMQLHDDSRDIDGNIAAAALQDVEHIQR
jgi:hypothetical protein